MFYILIFKKSHCVLGDSLLQKNHIQNNIHMFKFFSRDPMRSHNWFCLNRIYIGVLKLNDFSNKTTLNKPHLPGTCYPSLTLQEYGLNYYKTTGSHLLVMFSRLSVGFFVYVLVSVLPVSVTADFICSDLVFYCSEGVQRVRVAAAAALCAHI